MPCVISFFSIFKQNKKLFWFSVALPWTERKQNQYLCIATAARKCCLLPNKFITSLRFYMMTLFVVCKAKTHRILIFVLHKKWKPHIFLPNRNIVYQQAATHIPVCSSRKIARYVSNTRNLEQIAASAKTQGSCLHVGFFAYTRSFVYKECSIRND